MLAARVVASAVVRRTRTESAGRLSARPTAADTATTVDFLDAALHEVFASCAVDPERVSIEGFSDGASYALSLGLANGELFSNIVAFSPGFMAPGPLQGRPAIFVSHGVADRVLPIDRCSRRIVPELRVASYPVDYREFDGGHTVPPDIAAAGEAWVAQPKGGQS